jgi:hypothetical protein
VEVEPDLVGFTNHMNGLARGMSQEDLRQVFLTTPEYLARLAQPPPEQPSPTPVPPPAPTEPSVRPPPAEPGAPLASVPWREEPMWSQLANAPALSRDPRKAIVEAATWVRNNKPELFPLNGREEVRADQYKSMTYVIALLRANGFDATRWLNHATLPASGAPRAENGEIAFSGDPVRVG